MRCWETNGTPFSVIKTPFYSMLCESFLKFDVDGSEDFFAMCLFLQLCITFCVGNGNYPEVRDTCSSSVRDKQEVRQVRVMLKKGFFLVNFILPSPHETHPTSQTHKHKMRAFCLFVMYYSSYINAQ